MKQINYIGVLTGKKYSPALNLRRKACLNAYRIDRYPVTVDDYKRCIKAGKCPRANSDDAMGTAKCNWNKKGRGRHPINCVNWFQTQAYCRWAGGDLPSEAEWEVASGSQHGHYPWGKARPDCKRSVIDDKQLGAGCGVKHTHPVGSKPKGASEFGLMDTIGNVQEWTRDCISQKAMAKLGLKGQGAHHIPCVVKGYSFFIPGAMRFRYKIHGMEGTSYRSFARRNEQHVALGFRCMYLEKQ